MRSLIKMGLSFLLVLATTISFAQNPIDNYPTPPRGIYWGWQDQIFFDFDRAVLRQEAKSTLDRIITMMQGKAVNLLVTGHTDNTGDLAYNRKLSAKRAQAVIEYMNENGISTYRIVTRSTGEERPVANNACREDRRRNRRADLAFFPEGYEPPPVNEKLFAESQPEAGECEQAIEDARQH